MIRFGADIYINPSWWDFLKSRVRTIHNEVEPESTLGWRRIGRQSRWPTPLLQYGPTSSVVQLTHKPLDGWSSVNRPSYGTVTSVINYHLRSKQGPSSLNTVNLRPNSLLVHYFWRYIHSFKPSPFFVYHWLTTFLKVPNSLSESIVGELVSSLDGNV